MSQLRTLVISPNWIGDAVMAQPLLQLLKAAHPERAIDVLAPPAVSPVWRQMVEVAEVLETPFRHGALQLKERWKYARLLRQRGYADAYVLPNTIKYALIPWLAGIPQRVGYKGESRYGLINLMHHDETPPRPMVAFYAALGGPVLAQQTAAMRSALPKPRMQVAAAQREAVCAKLGIAVAQPVLALAPGAEFGGAKRWPASHFAALARAVVAQQPATQVILLGSPKDKEACSEVAAQLAGAQVFNLAGVTSLAEAIALIAGSSAVVANDSGLLHIASALNRPVVALYGPTDPDHAPPFSDLAASISLRLACAPCKQRECPLGHQDCMVKLAPELVWQRLQPMLAAG
ncbi:lipopolysaccharide heptosyltransferase II [Duganella qianjiadongensis]|uniref:lipopolysaccharide heptosyltransferase II n=1 Tax=Duganella qianjiadongensis TaxID=2692176 RepID=A0ABW9VI10_9BURK|nr:lipopolysaccharide heptosyltransferase II [Duganella qianjiadongensis]MYM38671.1 lipopolysaccharide heptosyltransferase II [Duganella qianjiadongensis]